MWSAVTVDEDSTIGPARAMSARAWGTMNAHPASRRDFKYVTAKLSKGGLYGANVTSAKRFGHKPWNLKYTE
jgi:hypothetical protein